MTKPLDEDLRVRVVGAVRGHVTSRLGGSFWGQHLERDPVGQAGAIPHPIVPHPNAGHSLATCISRHCRCIVFLFCSFSW